MTQFCDNMKEKISRRIDGKRHYIRGGGVLEGFKKYIPSDEEEQVYKKEIEIKAGEYPTVELQEDSDDETATPSIKLTIERKKKGVKKMGNKKKDEC